MANLIKLIIYVNWEFHWTSMVLDLYFRSDSLCWFCFPLVYAKQILSLVPELVNIFAQVLVSPEETSEVKAQVGRAFSHLISLYGQEMQPLLSNLPPAHANALAAFVPSSWYLITWALNVSLTKKKVYPYFSLREVRPRMLGYDHFSSHVWHVGKILLFMELGSNAIKLYWINYLVTDFKKGWYIYTYTYPYIHMYLSIWICMSIYTYYIGIDMYIHR